MAMTWAQVRDGIKARLDTITGLIASDVFTETAQHNTAAMVLPGEPLVTWAGHGSRVSVNVLVRVQCVRATVKDSQDALDDFVWPTGASSIVAAIAGDDTLGGIAHAVKFLDVRNYGRVENTMGAGADIALEVVGSA